MAEAVMAIGTVVSVFGQFKQADIAKKQEKLRKRQMNLEAQRRQRDIIREGIRARATASLTLPLRGAAEGSGLQGGYGQITGAMNRNILALGQDQAIGNKMFKRSAQYADYGTVSSIGEGVYKLGQTWAQAQAKA